MKKFENPYFVSDGAMFVFILTRMDGESKTRELGIVRRHFIDKELAKTWRDDIMEALDACEVPGKDKAVAETERIYQELIAW